MLCHTLVRSGSLAGRAADGSVALRLRGLIRDLANCVRNYWNLQMVLGLAHGDKMVSYFHKVYAKFGTEF